MMKLKHSAINSDFFELVKMMEFDILFDQSLTTIRIELFQSIDRDNRFRARLWELESMRLTPTQPQDESGEPTEITDDPVLLERSHGLTSDFTEFEAQNVMAALRLILVDIGKNLKRMTNETPKLEVSERTKKDTWF